VRVYLMLQMSPDKYVSMLTIENIARLLQERVDKINSDSKKSKLTIIVISGFILIETQNSFRWFGLASSNRIIATIFVKKGKVSIKGLRKYLWLFSGLFDGLKDNTIIARNAFQQYESKFGSYLISGKVTY